MSDEDDYAEGEGDEVGEMQGAAAAGATAISPSWTWGSTTNIVLEAAAPVLFQPGVTTQLAQVALPEPAVCSVYFQASVTSNSPLNNLRIFNIRFSQGVGRTTVIREISYLAQPAPNAPLEVTLPFMPLHALQVDVFTAADFGVAGRLDIAVSLILTPLTRIPQKEQKLAFGMAMPGEADDLDDELRGDLETEGPTATQAVMEGRDGFDASDGAMEHEGEDEDEPEHDPRRALLQTIVHQLTNRYGRKPTRTELKLAVQRLRARRARRLRSRGR